MSGTLIIAAVSALNLMLVMVLLSLFLRDSSKRNKLIDVDRQSFHESLAHLSERLKDMTFTPKSPPTEITPAYADPASREERVRIGMHKIRIGEDSGNVCRQLGFSRAEVGLMTAINENKLRSSVESGSMISEATEK